MVISTILNFILGGGLLTTLVSLFTLKSKVRKESAEAMKATAEGESIQITNVNAATKILMGNIVMPLKDELSTTRQKLSEVQNEFSSTKRAMVRLRKAIEMANSCKYSDNCPVLDKLRNNPKNKRENESGKSGTDIGQHRLHSQMLQCEDGSGTNVASGDFTPD